MESNYSLVLDALRNASSQNAELLKVAEQHLKCWETQAGFYSTLINIACDKYLDINIRWLAVLCLKNGVERYWKRPSGSISNEEKGILRQKLLESFSEHVNQIAVQFAVIIAKVARYDCPKEWPDLFPTLLNLVQASDDLNQQRALLTMHHVIKTLATKRLLADRRTFYQLTSSIFGSILQQWVTHSSSFLQQINHGSSSSKACLEKALFTLKILRKLLLYGFKELSKVEDAMNLLSMVFQQMRPFVHCRKLVHGQDTLVEMCEKYSILLVKVLRDTLEYHPFAFLQFVRPTLECCVAFCFTKEYEDYLFEKLTVQFLNVIKAILQCPEYKLAKLPEDTKNALTVEAHNIKTEFFTYPVLREMCHQIVSRYFLLSDFDIKNWQNSPEDFASDEGVESWKYNLRPCTEVLFLSLFREFRDVLTPLVVQMVESIHSANSHDFSHILKKEAVYNAVGLAAFDLYDEIDFDQWFTTVLIPELKMKETNYHIIRRRVICLIGQWVGVKMSPEVRPLLYEIVIHLLSADENLVVRLAAANTLKVAVNDFEFSTEQFLPYLDAMISALFNLLKEVKECDLKMSVLNVLSLIVERMGCQVRPYACSLMQYLPHLWENCGDHNMLRCVIITCFVHLVQGLGTLSEKLQPFLLSMIALSTDVSQPPHVYLLEDGLELWWSVLDNSSVCSAELLNLGRNIIALLEYNSESLRMCLQITQGYLLISPQGFLEKYGSTLVGTFSYIMTDMRTEGIVMILRLIENAFVIFPEEGPVLFHPILSTVLSSVLKDEDLPLTLSVYLSLLSRVILHNPNCFADLLLEKASESHKEIGVVLGKLLDIWIEKMPLINPVERRKLLGLALACLLTTGSEVVYDRICGILLAIVEVLNDITKCDNLSAQTDSLVLKPEDFVYQEEDEETEHDRRKKELSKQDPVHTIVLRDYLYSQISRLQQSVGASKFEDFMGTVDVETMQQLQQYLHC